MDLLVYKFGGASVKDAAGVKNLARIVGDRKNRLLIVVSAMGKTTNALEALTRAYLAGEPTDAIFADIKAYHGQIMNELFGDRKLAVYDDVANLFVEIDWVLEEDPHADADYTYDQIVSIGELVSTRIVNAWLQENGVPGTWVDARSIIQTDNTYREGAVNWDKTRELAQKTVLPVLDNGIVVTQGFLGGTSENYTTTLGREGSDYSAAIFASCLDAASMTIWKDVPGVLSADPKLFDDTVKYKELHYNEALEMTYYGATVIHPKTIKPLQNAGIPLYVKPFGAPADSGTMISGKNQESLVHPAVIVKKGQVLLSAAARDHSFITEEHLSRVFGLFAALHVKVNVLQVSAVSLSICVDMDDRKFGKLVEELSKSYILKYNAGLELITVRHFRRDLLDQLTSRKTVLLEQLSRSTAQLVLKPVT